MIYIPGGTEPGNDRTSAGESPGRQESGVGEMKKYSLAEMLREGISGTPDRGAFMSGKEPCMGQSACWQRATVRRAAVQLGRELQEPTSEYARF